MQSQIQVGTVSWINDTPNPMYSTLQTLLLSPDWIPKTYLGLSGTSNSAPPETLTDFPGYQNTKDFRAMTFCHFSANLDDATGRIMDLRVLKAFHDGGWTPDFKMRNWPTTVFSFDTDIYSYNKHEGESSPLSVVRTEGRHPNTAISTVPKTETVLVNALIKFRAGKNTDEIGIKSVRSNRPWNRRE